MITLMCLIMMFLSKEKVFRSEYIINIVST